MPAQLPGVLKVVVSRRRLAETLDRTEDLMPGDRPKVIHTVGVVAPIELRTEAASPFTGLPAAPPGGGAIGVIRMSFAAPTTRKKVFRPGFGLKLLVDGRPSQDTLAANHINGQGRDFNMFSNSLSHDLTHQHTEHRSPQIMMSKLFRRVSCEPGRLSIVPDKLVFNPTAAARNSFTGRAGHDSRDVLADFEAGTALYDVVATDLDRRIASIVTTGPFTASLRGDRLFFRHVQHATDRIQR